MECRGATIELTPEERDEPMRRARWFTLARSFRRHIRARCRVEMRFAKNQRNVITSHVPKSLTTDAN